MKPSVFMMALVFLFTGCDCTTRSAGGDQPPPDTLVAPLVPDNDPAWQKAKRVRQVPHLRHKRHKRKVLPDSSAIKKAGLRTGQPL